VPSTWPRRSSDSLVKRSPITKPWRRSSGLLSTHPRDSRSGRGKVSSCCEERPTSNRAHAECRASRTLIPAWTRTPSNLRGARLAREEGEGHTDGRNGEGSGYPPGQHLSGFPGQVVRAHGLETSTKIWVSPGRREDRAKLARRLIMNPSALRFRASPSTKPEARISFQSFKVTPSLACTQTLSSLSHAFQRRDPGDAADEHDRTEDDELARRRGPHRDGREQEGSGGDQHRGRRSRTHTRQERGPGHSPDTQRAEGQSEPDGAAPGQMIYATGRCRTHIPLIGDLYE